MNRKKAQASFELLTTYGWALLALLGILAGMSYFGLFDSGRFVSTNCNLDTSLGCPTFATHYEFGNTDDHYVFNINFENYLSQPIYVVDFIIKTSGADDGCHPYKITDLSDPAKVLCTPALLPGASNIYSNCGAIIAPFGTIDLMFEYEEASCNLTESGLDDPLEGRKRAFDIKLYYLKGQSDKPLVASGKLVSSLTDLP